MRVASQEVVDSFDHKEKLSYNLNRICKIREHLLFLEQSSKKKLVTRDDTVNNSIFSIPYFGFFFGTHAKPMYVSSSINVPARSNSYQAWENL